MMYDQWATGGSFCNIYTHHQWTLNAIDNFRIYITARIYGRFGSMWQMVRIINVWLARNQRQLRPSNMTQHNALIAIREISMQWWKRGTPSASNSTIDCTPTTRTPAHKSYIKTLSDIGKVVAMQGILWSIFPLKFIDKFTCDKFCKIRFI